MSKYKGCKNCKFIDEEIDFFNGYPSVTNVCTKHTKKTLDPLTGKILKQCYTIHIARQVDYCGKEAKDFIKKD